jgi:hypothetical protein
MAAFIMRDARYLPSSSTYDRMMYTIQSFISQGMYVILDYQPMVSRSLRLHVGVVQPPELTVGSGGALCVWVNV